MTTPTISVLTGTGTKANIATVTLADGTTAVAHVLIDDNSNIVALATQADIQAMSAALATVAPAIQALAAKSLTLTDAFGNAAATDAFGNAI